MQKENKALVSKQKVRLPRTEAAIKAYAETGVATDPLGMWTGRVRADGKHPEETVPEVPVQDADDL